MSQRPRLSMVKPRITTVDARRIKPPPKTAAPIYSTPEFQAWRAKVIGRAGGCCQWPGCGRKEHRMFADHIHEVKDGGAPYDVANGQCLCGSHHTTKTIQERAKRAARQE